MAPTPLQVARRNWDSDALNFSAAHTGSGEGVTSSAFRTGKEMADQESIDTMNRKI